MHLFMKAKNKYSNFSITIRDFTFIVKRYDKIHIHINLNEYLYKITIR